MRFEKTGPSSFPRVRKNLDLGQASKEPLLSFFCVTRNAKMKTGVEFFEC